MILSSYLICLFVICSIILFTKYTFVSGCFCGKEHREVKCDGKIMEGDQYSCKKTCESKLTCGEHNCEQLCHEGVCGACQRDPLQVTHCHCGKTALTKDQTRTSCLDPIPSCGKACGRQLPCGQPGQYYFVSLIFFFFFLF